MTARHRMGILAMTAVLLAGGVGGIATYSLYRTSVAHDGELLRAVVRAHQTLAGGVFEDELAELGGDSAAAVAGTLEQLRIANRRFVGFGTTGEFAVARLIGDTIRFEIGIRGDSVRLPAPVVLPSPLATAVQKALQGNAGVSEERDYAGTRVLAAYGLVPGTGLAMVAKMDLREIRRPYVRAAILAGLAGAVLLLIALLAAQGVARDLLAEVEEREDAHRALLDDFPGIVFRVVGDERGGWRIQVLEGAVEEITGASAEELRGSLEAWRRLVHEEDQPAFDRQWESVGRGEAHPEPSDYRLVRPDGRQVWVRVKAGVRGGSGPAGTRGAAVSGVMVDVTSERRALEVRSRAEAELHALVRHLPKVAVHILDRDLRYRYSGGQALSDIGLTHEDLAGKRVADVLEPELAEKFATMYARVLAGDTGRLEGTFGGREFEVTAAPLRGPDGTVDRILALSLDVTRERLSEAALKESEERLRLAVTGGGHGLWDLDLRTGEAKVNDAYARMIGYDPGTFVETNPAWRDRLHPEDRAAVFGTFEAYVAGELDEYRVEFRSRTAAGGWRWVLSQGEIVERDAEGRPVRMMGTHTDIQPLRDAEGALRESEDRFRRAVEASPVAIFIHAAGRFAYLNPAALALFGASRPEQLVGLPVLDRHAPEERAQVAERIQRLSQELQPTPNQVEGVVRLDGTAAWAEFTGVPFRFRGEDAGLVFAHDVTERLASEELIRAQVEELRRWQAVMLDREDRVQELKQEVNELCRHAGQPPRYASRDAGVATEGSR